MGTREIGGLRLVPADSLRLESLAEAGEGTAVVVETLGVMASLVVEESD
jgi:hypothetical protein